MQRKLTITLDESVYNGLYELAGKGNISRYIESLVRPHIIGITLEQGYKAMARDSEREREAEVWSEATIGDVADDMW